MPDHRTKHCAADAIPSRAARCRFGFHRWSAWEISHRYVVATPPLLAAFGKTLPDAPAQERRCSRCGRVDVREL
jgi:hypothetical protein